MKTLKSTVLIAIIMMCSMQAVHAQAQYKLYAGFMYHFAKFTQWPSAKSGGDFVIGVYGSSDMAKSLSALAASKKLGARKIVVKQYKSASSVENCHILFVAKGKTSDLGTLSGTSKTKNMMIVTESSGAAKKGSTINFVQKDGKIKFEMNPKTAKSQSLKISSELQKLGIIVQ